VEAAAAPTQHAMLMKAANNAVIIIESYGTAHAPENWVLPVQRERMRKNNFLTSRQQTKQQT